MGAGVEMMVMAANGVAWALLLWGERRRLPRQNVVALAVLSLALGVVFEEGMAWVGWTEARAGILHATSWSMAWLGARALARGGAGGSLAVRTLLWGALLMPGMADVGWRMAADVPQALGVAAARAGWLLGGFLVLAPWWIRKPLSEPRPPLRVAPVSAVVAALAQALAATGEHWP